MALVGRASVSTKGPVLIVGTGLIGTSLGLALRAASVPVYLWDPSPISLALAADIGAGQRLPELSGTLPAQLDPPSLVVVAAPPDMTGQVVVNCLRAFPEAVVTDVASVKEAVVSEVLQAQSGGKDSEEPALAKAPDSELSIPGLLSSADLARYVGSHPMAGRARSGAAHADGDLFVGRPWVLVPTEQSSGSAVLAVRNLAADVGAVPLELGPTEHDQAVALVSHVPQLVSSLLASRLAPASTEALELAGQGLRDTTRIAASDPGLWTAIIAGNAGPVADILSLLQADLEQLVETLKHGGLGRDGAISPGVAGAIARVMAAGNRGAERIPGKHGSAPRRWGYVEVLVPDEPGELGRLFSELGAIDVNIEDLVLEHSARQPVGLARLMIDPMRVEDTEKELERRGWRVASTALK